MSEFVLTPPESGIPVGVPKLRVPFSMGVGSKMRAQVVEQDSIDEVAACVYAVLATKRGERDEEPSFGIEDQAFRQGGADLDEIHSAVESWEPRADILTEAQFDQLVQYVEVRVG